MGVTILIRRKGTVIPFNIQGLQIVEYDQDKFASIEQAKARIHQIIKNGLVRKYNDSPVHAVLDLNIEPEGKPLEETRFFESQLKSQPEKAIGLITGDILNVMGVDVWVNSENTNMQMSRPFENSISGVIRYLGADKDKRNNQITDDTIVKALQKQMGKRTTVDPATVIVTTSGAMEKSHKVKRIFHVAANYGQVGQGYAPIDQVSRCVVNALKETADTKTELESILFPLMATRSRRATVLEDRVKPLLSAAIDYLERVPDCRFRRVYFLAYTDKELEVCQDILRADSRLQLLRMMEVDRDEPFTETQVTESDTWRKPEEATPRSKKRARPRLS